MTMLHFYAHSITITWKQANIHTFCHANERFFLVHYPDSFEESLRNKREKETNSNGCKQTNHYNIDCDLRTLAGSSIDDQLNRRIGGSLI